MRTLCKSVVLGATLTIGAALSAHAAEQFGPAPNPASMVQTSPGRSFDPYTGGASACPQGAPFGGPKCNKLIPDSTLNR